MVASLRARRAGRVRMRSTVTAGEMAELRASVAETPPPLRRGSSATRICEDVDAHEAWQTVLAQAGSLEMIHRENLDQLVIGGGGMPLKYRHLCWPRWLGVPALKEQADKEGRSYAVLAAAELPEDVKWLLDADIPRTRQDFVPPEQLGVLRRLLVGLSAYNPDVGYAQGMNQLASVFIKLGFEEEDSFWMLVSVIEVLLPGCHAPDLHGLHRDTAVVDALLQAYLPVHCTALTEAGVDLLWISAEYFLTLGASNSPLELLVRLWDLCFLHGPRALFCCLTVQLELFFPVGGAADAAEAHEPEALVRAYREARQQARSCTVELFSVRVLHFLHERQGGIAAAVIAELRSEFELRDADAATSSRGSTPEPPAEALTTAGGCANSN
eukprot:NODE_6741_length_1643_cov_3.528364.p1 GENE.NODE_6741_length_1643_cov_3.528364~~NODE_6741_length_1643_cov_3.528364.p1  ORF type:complete len:428 (+),score=112.58 NODE_6741_length_1643_cov_3.528364:134-1285(+)